MNTTPRGSPGDYWANESPLGARTTWRFEGAEGLERLSGPGRYTAVPAAAFRAQLARVQLDHVAIEAFHATPHRWRRDAEHIRADPTAVLTVVFLTAGVLEVDLLGEPSFVLEPHQIAVLDSRQPKSYTSSGDVRMVRSVVGIEHIPAMLQERGTTVAGPLAASALTDSFFAFSSVVLRTARGPQPTAGGGLVAAIADLQAAVLAQAQHRDGYPTGPAGLRYQIEEYVETHYRDPRLGPAQIADALNVSTRTLHAVFNDGERTIARFIRDRRLTAVALELRTAPVRTTIDDLAHRHGFSSGDVLSRAFRERFAMALGEYRNGGHRALG